MEITDVISKSYDIIIKNPVLLLPLIIWEIVTGLATVVFIVLFMVLLPASLLTGLSTAVGAHGLNSSTMTSTMEGFAHGAYVGGSFFFAIFLMIIFIIVFFLFWLILPAFYVSMVKQISKNKKVSLGSAFYEARSKYLSLLGAYLIQAVVVAAIVILFLAVSFGMYMLIHSWAALAPIIAFCLVLLIVLLYVMILFYQTTPAVMIEGLGAFDAVKRSMRIGRANIFSILVLFVLFGMMWVVLDVVSSVTAVIVIGIIIGIVGGIFLNVMQLVAVPLFYYGYVDAGKPVAKAKIRK